METVIDLLRKDERLMAQGAGAIQGIREAARAQEGAGHQAVVTGCYSGNG